MYYSWQVQTMLNNFIEVGINQTDIHILLSYDGEVDVKTHYVWNKVIERYSDVNFYFYPDLRINKSYVSSIRPNVLSQFYKDYPKFSDLSVFYHDCDILFTKPVDFSQFLNDDVWYLSDTNSYINSDYIKSKSFGVYEKMCEIIDIDKSIPEKWNNHSGGAQYILKGIDYTFWEKVETDSEKLFVEMTEYNNDIKKDNPLYHELQIWCADMWALLWNGWKAGHVTKVVEELNFCWATDPIEFWDKNTIYHNAGITNDMPLAFNKSNYQNTLPINLDISKINKKWCNYNYVNAILKTNEL
jgi:hypothetical protein